MKVLQVITSLEIGGVEKLLVELVPKLCSAGIDTDVLVLNDHKTPFTKALNDSGVRVISCLQGASVYDPRHIPALKKIIGEYDIVHTHNTSPQLFGAIASLFEKRPVMVTTEHNTYNRRRDWKWFRPIDRWMYNRYDAVVCVSNEVESCLRSHLGYKTGTPIETIHNGIDLETIRLSQPDSRYRDSLPGGSVVILMVAAFRYQKDQDTLIHALKLLPDKFHAFFVGEGHRTVECQNLAESLGVSDRAHFIGRQMNIGPLLKSADISILLSKYEGLSLSSIECMASGTPFIASDVPGLHEIVSGAGILVDPGSPETVAKSIVKLTEDPEYRESVIEACMKRAANYNLERIATGYTSLYKKLAQK